MNKTSDTQKEERKKSEMIMWELFQVQGGKCAKCSKFLNYRALGCSANYPHLHQKKIVLCPECHSKEHH